MLTINKEEVSMSGLTSKADELNLSRSGWLQNFRSGALARFNELGLPTSKTEEWKYTSLKSFSEKNWQPAEPCEEVFNLNPTFFEQESIKIVLVNGRFDRNLSEIPNVPGVTAKSFTDALVENQEVITEHLGKAGAKVTQAEGREIQPDEYPFGLLNDSSFEDGFFLHIANDSVVEPLIEIVHLESAGEVEHTVSFPRILIIAGRNSHAKIVESYLTAGCHPAAVVPVTEVFIREGANVEHVRLQDQCGCSTNIALWQAHQSKSSSYVAFNIVFGGKLARLDQTIWIDGEDCTTRLDGVVCANREQHIDNHTRLDHAVPNCNSFEIYKQILDEESTVVFNGKIFVHQDAQKTDAKQTNQALLLSPKATINSKPQLEIFADDVKCTHGATVGQLEDLPMFYMRSRGIDKAQAQAVLVYAFAAEVLEMISVDSVREVLEQKLYKKLGIELGD